MVKTSKGIFKRHRPDGWDQIMPELVKECIKEGDIQIDDEKERPNIEGFIRYCIGVGGDLMLEGVRSSGAIAQSRNGQILIQVRNASTWMPIKNVNYPGLNRPGRLVFIPDDQEVIKVAGK